MRGSKLLLRQLTRADSAREHSPYLAKLQTRILDQKIGIANGLGVSATRQYSQSSKPSLVIQKRQQIPAPLPTRKIESRKLQKRLASSSPIVKEAKSTSPQPGKEVDTKEVDIDDEEAVSRGFARSEKASQAAQVNLSARLAKDGKSADNSLGAGEIVRLLRIAKPEAKWLGGMYQDPQNTSI
jgi:hypothetical protein